MPAGDEFVHVVGNEFVVLVARQFLEAIVGERSSAGENNGEGYDQEALYHQ